MSFNVLQKVKKFFVQLAEDVVFRILPTTNLIEEDAGKIDSEIIYISSDSLFNQDNKLLTQTNCSFLHEEFNELIDEDILDICELQFEQLSSPIVDPLLDMINFMIETKPIEQPMPIDVIGQSIIKPPNEKL